MRRQMFVLFARVVCLTCLTCPILLTCLICLTPHGTALAEKDTVVGKVVKVADGDTVTVIKDLKVKGSSAVVKVGTRVKNIRLVGGDHDIDCKIDGIGAMKLKSEFVKKA